MATPPMDQNLRDLLFALNKHSVKYVVIGGYAVAVHAQPRMTKDMDVFIESSPPNALATFKALAEFGAPLSDFTIADFHTPTVCGSPDTFSLTNKQQLPPSVVLSPSAALSSMHSHAVLQTTSECRNGSSALRGGGVGESHFNCTKEFLYILSLLPKPLYLFIY